MPLIPTKWTLGDFIPRNGLQAWHAADTAATGQTVFDASGNGRDLDAGEISPAPALVQDFINGHAAIVFDGSTHGPLNWTGTMSAVKHAFVFAGYEDAAFPASTPGNAGLLGGVTSGDILVGNSSSTRFFDYDYEGSGAYKYRRRQVAFDENDLQASFDDQITMFEVSFDAGFPLDGIQVGRQRTFADRLWKGPWCEHILYNRVLTENEIRRVYWYGAMKYHLWPQSGQSNTLNVFPFASNKTIGGELTLEHYLSEPYEGDLKALIRGSARVAASAPFSLRHQEEFLAAREFWKQHHPIGNFVFRDYRYQPPMDIKSRFVSPIREQGSDVSYRFNYSFDFLEVE